MEGAEASYATLGTATPSFLTTKTGWRRRVWGYPEDRAMELLTLEVNHPPSTLQDTTYDALEKDLAQINIFFGDDKCMGRRYYTNNSKIIN